MSGGGPANWPKIRLRDLLKEGPTNVFSPNAEPGSNGTKSLKLSATTSGSLILDERTTKTLCVHIEPRSKFWLETGDLLVQRSNTLEHVGVSAIYDGPSDTYIYPDLMMRLRFSNRETATWVWRFLNSETGRRNVRRLASGSAGNMPKINGKKLRELAVPLPPLPEQKRIAAILDKADELRAKRRAALAELDTLVQSIFLEMFGDPQGKGWPTVTIAEIVATGDGSIRTGPFGSQLLHSEFVDAGIAVLGIDNVVANEFRWTERRFISDAKYRQLKRYTVRPGDVLITIMGTCGRCAIVPEDVPTAINTKHLCCITLDPKKCLPLFLHSFFLRHPLAQQYLGRSAKGAIMAGLNMGLIKAMPLPLPPLPLQRTFADRVAAVEKLKAAHRASLAELDALFASLQHRAFRGEL